MRSFFDMQRVSIKWIVVEHAAVPSRHLDVIGFPGDCSKSRLFIEECKRQLT